jgi:hypothetical protein
MNRNVTTKVRTAPAPVRATALRSARPQPRKSGIVGRIVRWFVFLGIVGAIIASFFVKADDKNTYADLYTKPAFRWAKDKVFPPETETGTAKKEVVPAGPSELDLKFEKAVTEREKATKSLEAADEATIEKELDASVRRIDAVREVGLAAPKMTKVTPAQAVEELAAQARAQKAIAAALAKLKTDLAVKAALAAVPPPPPPPPPVIAYDSKKLQAWPARTAGTWVRWKKTVGEMESYEDHVLATLTDEAAVVRIEEVPGNVATAERVFLFGGRVVREEAVKIGDAEIPCRVVQSGSTLRWIPKEGPAADRVALKVQAGDQTTVVTELGEEEVPVKGEAKKCLKVTVGDVTTWGHDDVPGFAVRVKTGNEIAEAIEWGTDLAARPASRKKTPPAALPEVLSTIDSRPVKSLLAEAEQLTNEGSTLLLEVIETMKEPPPEPERLRVLLLKTESASTMLGNAWERYRLAKEKVLDPTIDEKVSKLSRVVQIAAEYSVSIKSRLK